MPDEPEPSTSSRSEMAEQDPQEEPEQSDSIFDIDVAVSDPAWKTALPDVERICVESALAVVGAATRPTELSIVLGSDAEIRVLNRDYRSKDKATNVLSFPSGLSPEISGTDMLGDVILAFETVSAEAVRDSKTLESHLRHLVVHGVLHLLGYDHETDDDAVEMERREIEILAGFGIADPYRPILESVQ